MERKLKSPDSRKVISVTVKLQPLSRAGQKFFDAVVSFLGIRFQTSWPAPASEEESEKE